MDVCEVIGDIYISGLHAKSDKYDDDDNAKESEEKEERERERERRERGERW